MQARSEHISPKARQQAQAHKLPAARTRLSQQHDVVIPEKLYFRIGEVADLCNLPPSVLRFWETEFAQLKPTKGSTGQRMYRRREVENILRVRELLYGQGFTIAGARQFLRQEQKSSRGQVALPFPSGRAGRLKSIRGQMEELLAILKARRAAAN